MRWLAALLLLLLSPAAAAADPGYAQEEIDLDLPPSERWVAFATKYRDVIINKCKSMGVMYQASLGQEITSRWVKSAHMDADLRAEYESLIRIANHPEVTLDCLVITDMWQAVDAPTFGCTGLLAAMPNGTVLHGRNIDYDVQQMAKQTAKTHAGIGGNKMVDLVLKKGGEPIVSMLAQVGSMGTHTGMRLGRYSVNSNARLKNNKMMDNLQALEAGGRNFPWVLRRLLETQTDFASAVQTIETTDLSAPNYFIFAGAGPYEGAIVTKDRLGTHEASTPPTQRLDAAKGVWHLVQTNDDLLSPPEDNRRGTALMRLGSSQQSRVDMDFVQGEMQSSPVFNSDTILTWVGNPSAGTHRVIMKSSSALGAGLASKVLHRALHMPMPQDLPKTKKAKPARAKKARKAKGSLKVGEEAQEAEE